MKNSDSKKPAKASSPKKGNTTPKSAGNGWDKTLRILKLTGTYLYKFRAVIISLPVAVASIVLACQNMARLPDTVGINLLSEGDYSFMVPKAAAVLIPVVITALCILLTLCSKRTLYPWVVSVFTLVLPVLIWLTNIYPA